MKKLLATILTLILIISVFSALPVMAEENADKLINELNKQIEDIKILKL